jgi:peptidoglycan/xylan/chitin deacetylase (PgdA/CDA1 family)
MMIGAFSVLAVAAAIYGLFFSPWSQIFGRFVWRVKTSEKIVALTFDDGPNDPTTGQILDVLDTHGAAATFFMVGRNVERVPDIARQIAASRHEIGNHSYSHQFRRYFTQPSYAGELKQTQHVLGDAAGVEPTLFRPPWLWRTPWVLRTAVREHLVPVAGTFCHPFEVFHADGERIARATLRKIKPGAIMIFHDGFNARPNARRTETVRAVELVASRLADDGWEMLTISELLRRGHEHRRLRSRRTATSH